MDSEKLIGLVYYNLDNSDTDNELLRREIETSDAYYFGRLPGAAPTGRSSAVMLEVQTMCTAVSAELVQGYTSDQPAAFEPIGDGDDVSAELESYAVSSVLEDAGGYQVMSAAIDSGLRYGLAAASACIVDKTEVETERLAGASAGEVAALLAQLPDDMEAEIVKATDEETVVQIKRQTQEVQVRPIDVSLLRYRKDWPSPDIRDIPFIAIEHREQTRAQLLELFPNKRDIIKDLPADTGGNVYDSATRSKLVGEERSHMQADSRENDMVTWHEVWQEIPKANGLTERRRVAVSNRKLLLDEDWQGPPPIALGTCFPQPHRVQGISLAAKLFDIQERSSIGARQLEDNLSAGNLAKTYGYDVNLEDATSARANGHVRMNSPNSQFGALPPIDNASQSLAYLGFMKEQRAERGGAALSLQSPDSQLMDSQIGAVASQQMIGHQEQLSAYISQNLGETFVRNLYILIHDQLRRRFDGTLSLRRADQFVEVSPSSWPARSRLTLKAGMSPSARNRKAANLMQTIQLQMGLLQSGAPIASVDGLHAAIRDWGMASDLDSINQYITDPQSPTGQQAAQQAAQAGQVQQQMTEMQVQLEQMDRQLKAQEIENKRLADEAELRWKYYDTNADNERTEATLVTNAIIEERKASQGAKVPGGNGANGEGQG